MLSKAAKKQKRQASRQQAEEADREDRHAALAARLCANQGWRAPAGPATCGLCSNAREHYLELPCGHQFHRGCILAQKTPVCPLCRRPGVRAPDLEM